MSFSSETENLVNQLINAEYLNAVVNYGEKYNSLHEGYGVLLEEVEEVEEGHSANKLFLDTLWGNIKGKPIYRTNYDCLNKMLNNVKHTIKELAQVGAVLQKIKNTIVEVEEMTENQLSSNMSIQEDVLKLRVENRQLKQQIEKMKCCGNCKHRNAEEVVETCRKLKNYTLIKGFCSEWEFAE